MSIVLCSFDSSFTSSLSQILSSLSYSLLFLDIPNLESNITSLEANVVEKKSLEAGISGKMVPDKILLEKNEAKLVVDKVMLEKMIGKCGLDKNGKDNVKLMVCVQPEVEFVRLVRNHEVFKLVPIIAVIKTNTKEPMELIDAVYFPSFMLGVSEILKCPVVPEVFKQACQMQINFASCKNNFSDQFRRSSAEVLVIDDDKDVRDQIFSLLTATNISCDSSGVDINLLSKIEAGCYEFVLFGVTTHCDTPQSLERTVEFLSAILNFHVIVCVMVHDRNLSDATFLSKCYELGVHDHFTKPIVPIIIKSKCISGLKQFRARNFSLQTISSTLKVSVASIKTPTVAVNGHRRRSTFAFDFDSSTLMEGTPGSKVTSGLTIDDFDLISLIGEGAFGKVLMVRYKKTSKVFAMKIIRKAEVVTSDKPRQVLSERQILELVDNPFIVNLYVAFQDEDNLYLVLKFAGGGDLFTQLEKRRRLPDEAARFYAAELVLAIEALHKNSVIYRDLKPENILLNLDGHLLLTDFGMSKQMQTGKLYSDSLCGTPEYLAPEIVEGKIHTFAVDWWCLGIILYEMLVGKTPFHSRELTSVVQKILNEKVTYPPYVSTDAISFIDGLLQRDPNKRLGCSWIGTKNHPSTGATDIKSHPYFTSIRWDKLFQKRITPPYLPINDEVHIEDPDGKKDIPEASAKENAASIFREFKNFIHPELIAAVKSVTSPAANSPSVPESVQHDSKKSSLHPVATIKRIPSFDSSHQQKERTTQDIELKYPKSLNAPSPRITNDDSRKFNKLTSGDSSNGDYHIRKSSVDLEDKKAEFHARKSSIDFDDKKSELHARKSSIDFDEKKSEFHARKSSLDFDERKLGVMLTITSESDSPVPYDLSSPKAKSAGPGNIGVPASKSPIKPINASRHQSFSVDTSHRGAPRLAPLEVSSPQPQFPSPGSTRHLSISVNQNNNSPMVPPSPAYCPPNAIPGPAKLRPRQKIVAPIAENGSPKMRRNNAPLPGFNSGVCSSDEIAEMPVLDLLDQAPAKLSRAPSLDRRESLNSTDKTSATPKSTKSGGTKFFSTPMLKSPSKLGK